MITFAEEETNTKVSLCSPWVNHVNKLIALFGDDPDIHFDYDDDNHEVKLRVVGSDKAEALMNLLEPEVQFGNVTLKVTVIPANVAMSVPQMLANALKGNPHFSQVMTLDIGGNTFNYFLFKKEVAQYWNDNLGHPQGTTTTLYETLAEELLGNNQGALFCTEAEEE